MRTLFANRGDAGRQLAQRLTGLTGREHLIVLGLPRGGVPVAAEVARALAAPLDVFVVRKLGVPGHEELAMGAVASGGIRVINQETLTALHIPRKAVDEVTAREEREVLRREALYRGNRATPSFQGATVVLVDDGVATGSTMIAAIRALRLAGPAAVVAAAPLMSHDAYAAIAAEANACVTVRTPEPFYGVGAWYEDFTQTSDAEVLACLEAAAKPLPAPVAAAGR